MSRLEEKIAKLPPRPEWAKERIWTPDEEAGAAEEAVYEKGCVTLAGRRLCPRDLDAHTAMAYELVDLADPDDDFDPTDLENEADLAGGDLEAALAWAAARVCVLQQSLPSTPSAMSCPTATSTTGPLTVRFTSMRHGKRARNRWK